MAVQRRGESPTRHGMLDHGEAIAGFGTVDHEAHSDAAKNPALPSVGPTTFAVVTIMGPSFVDQVNGHRLRGADPEPGELRRSRVLGGGADLLQQARQVEVVTRLADVLPFDLEHLGGSEVDPAIGRGDVAVRHVERP